jgi:4-hydroxybenzoate polyprenyltransferase
MFSLLTALRPKQWLKNGFVVLPLFFAGLFANQSAIVMTLGAFVAFCLAASGTYLVNDVLDRQADRQHPTKQRRPIASGKVSTASALVVAAFLFVSALALGWCLAPLLAMILALYLVLHFLYSFGLKHIVILDLLAIALGFVLRVYGGAVVIGVTVSPWLVVLTFLLTLLLAVGKRWQELAIVGGSKARKVLSDYSPEFLEQTLNILLPAVFTAYLLYTFQSGHQPALIASVIPVTYGLLRYVWLLRAKKITTDGPTELLLADRPLQLAVLTWVITVYVVLGYF